MGQQKKVSISEFDKSTRAKRGLMILRELKSNPHRVIACKKISNQNNEIYQLLTDKGHIESLESKSIRKSDRYSNGSFIVDTNHVGLVTKVLKQLM